MTINETKVKEICTDYAEFEALKTAEEILAGVQLALGGETTIQSCETGEVITPGEIARARGILAFIMYHRIVSVS